MEKRKPPTSKESHNRHWASENESLSLRDSTCKSMEESNQKGKSSSKAEVGKRNILGMSFIRDKRNQGSAANRKEKDFGMFSKLTSSYSVSKSGPILKEHEEPERQSNGITLTKSKSKVWKLYNDMKKSKNPISPGRRITSFLHSFFGTRKGRRSEKEVKSEQASRRYVPSSSILASHKGHPKNGAPREVRFCTDEVILNQAYVPRDYPTLPITNVEDFKKKRDEEDDAVVEDGLTSCASSDLFELDDLNVAGTSHHHPSWQELPVFESTLFDINNAHSAQVLAKVQAHTP